jgi:diguanylate cyclase (GGDEF)-like protein
VPVTYATRFDELKATGQLPSPTGVALAIMRLAAAETTTPPEVARVLQTDPALAGRVLKLANSAGFGRSRPVVSVRDAVTHLGTGMVRTVALGFSLIAQGREGPCRGFDYAGFWSRSLATGVVAQAAAHHTRQLPAGEAFTCGLLAQVGRLALACIYPGAYGDVLAGAGGDDPGELCRRERGRFATDHNELTAALLKDWGLPPACQLAAEHHEQPDLSGLPEEGREQALTRLLSLAARLAAVCAAPEAGRAARVPAVFAAGDAVGIPRRELIELCDRVVAEWQEWGKILEVSTVAVPAFLELVQQAGQAAPAGAGAAPAEEGAALLPLKVVVVEDDAVELCLLTRHLTVAGHDVRTARDGVEGLRLILEALPQLVITDWTMPGMNGLDLCKALRQTKVGRQLYVIMLTGAEEEQSQIEAFEAGADDYVVKPFRPRVLAARVRACGRLLALQEEVRREKEELRRCMAELGVANRKLQQAALTDALTGLYNRRYALERLEQEWAAAALSGRPLACLLLDLDHFKRVNDTHGHDAGDLVLCETAAVLRGGLRQEDVVCRLGGEEFVVILPGADREAARACAERLRRDVEHHMVELPGTALRATTSVGVAVRTPRMSGPADLLKAADEAAYAAKQAGRNRVCVAAV